MGTRVPWSAAGVLDHVQEVLRALLKRGSESRLYAASVEGQATGGLSSVRVHELPKINGDALLAGNTEMRKVLAGRHRRPIYERYSLWSHRAMDFAARAGVRDCSRSTAPLIEEHNNIAAWSTASAIQVAERVFIRRPPC